MSESGHELFESYGKGITCIYGESATGKTTLAKLAAIAEAKEGGKVVFIDTEGSFNLERIRQLARGDFEKVLENVVVFRPSRFREQNKIIKALPSMKNIALVVVDTIGKHYRRSVKEKPWVYNFHMRGQLRILNEIAKEVPVIITNQVYVDVKLKKMRMIGEGMFRKWSGKILKLEKEPRVMVFEKPEGDEVGFEIKEEGVQKLK